MSSPDTFAPVDDKHYGPVGRLYHGLTTVDFVGRRKIWFSVSLVIIVLGLGSLGVRGFNFGIDFKGGNSWEVLAPHSSIADMTTAVKMVAGKVKVEASGGIRIDTIRAVAETGVDYISTSKIMQSAPAVDIGLDDAE